MVTLWPPKVGHTAAFCDLNLPSSNIFLFLILAIHQNEENNSQEVRGLEELKDTSDAQVHV